MAPPDDAACARFCDRSVMCSAVSIAVGSPISNLFRAGGFWLCQGCWGRMSALHLDGPREATSGCVGVRRAPSGSVRVYGADLLESASLDLLGFDGFLRAPSGSRRPRWAVWSVSALVGIRRAPRGSVERVGPCRDPSGSCRSSRGSPSGSVGLRRAPRGSELSHPPECRLCGRGRPGRRAVLVRACWARPRLCGGPAGHGHARGGHPCRAPEEPLGSRGVGDSCGEGGQRQ